MKKSSPLLALSSSALLLTGCVSNAEPAADVTDTESTTSPSPTSSPSPASTPEDSPSPAEAADEPVTASPEPSPEVSEVSEEPAAEPAVEETNVAEPTEAPITETSEPPIPGLSGTYDDLELVSTWDGIRVVRHVGTSWNIVGSGYAPGTEIQVSFGPAQTDSSLIGYPSVAADANGNYTFQISLPPDLAPGDYGILAVPIAGLTPDETEAAKRFAQIEVVSTW